MAAGQRFCLSRNKRMEKLFLRAVRLDFFNDNGGNNRKI